VQLLIADVHGTTVRRVHTAERFVRLGEGVDAHGHISAAARTRLLDALRAHQEIMQAHQVDDVVVAGTSALRDAANRPSVLASVQHDLGWTVEILSGAEEAAWSFAAACDAIDDLTGPCLVVDIGGGSTELIVGRAPAAHRPHYPDAILDRVSLPLGCVRLTERCFEGHPPRPEAVAGATQCIEDTLAAASLTAAPDPLVIGTAGTATALARVHAGPDSTWGTLHDNAGAHLSHADIQHWRERLFRLSVDDILALHPDAMQGRADVFPVGVLLLDCLLRRFDRDGLRVSAYELRHGLVLRALTAG
ncbi:MAG: exopolyphosphatase, partial [Salinibacter sp.]